MSDMQSTIEAAFEHRAEITPRSVDTHVKEATMEAIDMLDRGVARVAEKKDGKWIVNDWLKKAVLLSFRIEDNAFIKGGFTNYYDKVTSKYADTNSREFREGGVRVKNGGVTVVAEPEVQLLVVVKYRAFDDRRLLAHDV